LLVVVAVVVLVEVQAHPPNLLRKILGNLGKMGR
jgi:hypothetical protein